MPGLEKILGSGAPPGNGPMPMKKSDVDPDFEDNIVQVWPELEGDTERLAALEAAIRAVK
jgi:hypothetical protein